MLIHVSKLDEEQRRRILKKLMERLGLSQAAKQLGIVRSTLFRYISRSQSVSLEVVEEASQKLSVEEPHKCLFVFVLFILVF
ncbi:helix-turn-helix domain-containing protein [Acidianus manzaensis]|uniref:HTH cro/C1-type domain-containing protein n=1 Tax=Acidianus manzaensis TaxID=282676 RepID=A0A1W6K0X6_9CREN|nr:helix-turn-helix domain-containing protein [Acidianus manzaensis]ARM76147.1 hypothetical protein B6F84_09035 [Acidianus manzaensis]